MRPGTRSAAILSASGGLAPPVLTGLTLLNWLDPRFGTYTDAARTTPANVGDPVGGLADQVGSLHLSQSTTTKRPIVTLSSAGTRWLQFDGLDDYLITGADSQAQPFTIFMGVVMLALPGSSARLLQGSAPVVQIPCTTAGAVTFSAGASVSLGTLAANAPTGLVCVGNGASSPYTFNGAAASGSVGTNTFTGPTAFGAVSTGTSGFMSMYMGPFLRFSGAASADQVARIIAWARAAGYSS